MVGVAVAWIISKSSELVPRWLADSYLGIQGDKVVKIMNAMMLMPLVFLLAACSITQKVTPVGNLENRRICIIEDPAVRNGFLAEYQRTLTDKGYVVTVLPNGSGRDACEVTSTYTAKWSWDLAIYMSLAEIKVYRNGAIFGEAFYDSRTGGGRLDKFVDGGAKVRELVNQLFPN